MSARSIRPRGIFRARRTRDGEALSRDGQIFVLINDLSGTSQSVEGLVEIMFQDGIWMLAVPEDLDRAD